MLTCKTCNLQFIDRPEYQRHIRSCTTEVEVTCQNGVFVVFRNVAGHFDCQCGDDGCPRPFQSGDALKAHLKKKKSIWVTVDRV
ncbi:hypothetical protein CPB83DRAFT_287948 [Crepidotus variabilis]|uniref:C2H2-type domain-containing protein n=1 Tax=Crepidotus variabilis TaxID=179855 RepID=A0A9P6BCQ1_9AGAR|nr:hypothetical protein CPB83DRAFT_287948 [Crepidotus variabilis]